MFHYDIMETKCGELLIAIDEHGLRYVNFLSHSPRPLPKMAWRQDHKKLAPYMAQFYAYFASELQQFTLPFFAHGTPFQQTVWQALGDVPYGETRSYSDIAIAIEQPNAVRAVGTANGHNPLPIIIPCHRIIGKNGFLTGYSGGIAIKQLLLRLEGIDI